MQNKKYSLQTLILTIFVSALAGLLFACKLDLTQKTQAVDYPAATNAVPVKPSVAGLPSLTEIVKKIKPAVVNISSTHIVQNRPAMRRGGDPFGEDFYQRFFGVPQEYNQNSLGSGFIISKDGTILTNNHVVQNADEIVVKLSDGHQYQAKLVGNDPKTDLAIIRIEGGKGDFPTVPLGNSDQLEVGEWVIAVGNPFGLGQTVTTGIVSAKGRVIGAGPYDDFIQTDASINPGNSGGPLFNLNGEVIGINTAIIASGQGIGFAIPVNTAKNFAPQLLQKGKVTRGYLGVNIQDITPELAKSFGIKEDMGALVAGVAPGGPAEKAGVQAGDLVVAFNGKPISASHDLPVLVSQSPIGAKLPIEVVRKGQHKNFVVEVGELEQAERQIVQAQKEMSEMGIVVRDLNPLERSELGVKDQGVLVIKMASNSPAAWIGLRPGDVILEVNDTPVRNLADYTQSLAKTKSGQVLRMFVKRGNATTYFAFKK